MLTITKEFHFSASHQLIGLEEGHPCGRIHGHNYVLKVVLTGEVNTDGFIVDYRKLDFIKKWVDETLDHRHLNDIFNFQTSVENMTQYIFQKFKPQLPQLAAIELSETPKTNCRYEE